MVKTYVEMLKSQKLNKTYSYSHDVPIHIQSNVGKKWTDEEETTLLEELKKNIDIKTISQNHKRKIGGIESRRKEIAYKMYFNHMDIKEIIVKTRLNYETIKQIIDTKQNYNTKVKSKSKIPISINNDIIEIKNEIKDLKKLISELSDMMKAVYEFEHA
jgi:hypothetical protein